MLIFFVVDPSGSIHLSSSDIDAPVSTSVSTALL
jgi:hypothetical protein